MTGNDKIHNGSFAHDAGIIPRVLYQLFNTLELGNIDAAVRCSFLELYNEDLRDLISDEEAKKVIITDSTFSNNNNSNTNNINSNSRKSTSITRGQENIFVQSAEHGLKVLQRGLRKRQVAETKMNDHSSRSHTIFTLTVYTGAPPNSPDSVIGKINLVDLAGSENIGKSGAENKRAREAGMINQSLLTLGRVINALVDKSPHIPYRESKLTRLLQDSLGGQTRTCIIATVGPALSNLEETVSTLEYASKAKNIRNKAQVGAWLVSKTTLFREWSDDFVRLRNDWEATRKKNGVYLAEKHYKELMSENDERKLQIEEQSRKLVSVDGQLRSSRELIESIKQQLIETKRKLDSTKIKLNDTRDQLMHKENDLESTSDNLKQEHQLRQAHAKTETDLVRIGTGLIEKLDEAVRNFDEFQQAVKTQDQLDSENKQRLGVHTRGINQTFNQLDTILTDFSESNKAELRGLETTVAEFKTTHSVRLAGSTTEIDAIFNSVEADFKRFNEQGADSQTMLEVVLTGLNKVRADIKTRLADGLLAGLDRASQEVADGLADQLERYQRRTAQTLADLGRSCSKMVAELQAHSAQQAEEISRLNRELVEANAAASQETKALLSDGFEGILREQEQEAERSRAQLLEQFQRMMAEQEAQNNQRLLDKMNTLRESLTAQQDAQTSATITHDTGVAALVQAQRKFVESSVPGLNAEVSAGLKHAGDAAESHAQELALTAENLRSGVHVAAEEQVAELDNVLFALDEVSTSVAAHSTHTTSTSLLTCTRMTEYIQTRLGAVREGLSGAAEETDAMGAAVASYSWRASDAVESLAARHAGVVSDARAEAASLAYRVAQTRPVLSRPVYPRELPTTAASRQSTIIDEDTVTPARTNRKATLGIIDVNEDEEVPVPSTVVKDILAHEPLLERSPLSDISKNENENVVDPTGLISLPSAAAAAAATTTAGPARTSNVPKLVTKLRGPLKRRGMLTSPARKRPRGAADH
ncbi:hypothetical protein D0Z00_002240 [Geotrichum galactomycetum]|uniref:Uncharacterized protein n=1 Tax=Geotrichum galactomycetum TaxID=27317 RepID=A0ACB6V4S3_9ASCO|nr:hypothetical protein D0Z00_002240 [Geotrichum candidum]